MSKAPKVIHQTVSGNIDFIIRSQLKTGKLWYAPIGLFLSNETGVMPDIIVIRKENLDIVQEKGIYGVPEWIIEIMSPGNRKNDLIIKKELYEKFGVKEYWCVDTEIDQIHIFVNNKGFDETVIKSDSKEITSSVFGIHFKIAEIFDY